MQGPYFGDTARACWNARAYFATTKQQYARTIFEKCDFLGLVETHGTLGKEIAARQQPGCRQLWSHGTSSQAGVGLQLKDEFLQRFNPIDPTDWTDIEAG